LPASTPFSVLVDKSVDYNDPELTYIFKCSRGYHVDLLKALLTFRLANKKLARSSTKHCLFLGLQIKVSQQIDKNIACFPALQKSELEISQNIACFWANMY